MNSSNTRPKILVARRIFPEGIERLEAICDVDYVDQIEPLTKVELALRLIGKDGALVTGSERIDTDTIKDAKALKIISNIAVGFNNFDVEALNQRGIVGTNTPDVLTDTTADMGFALLMAISRRLSEAERWLRDGQWHHWEMGRMLGVDIHHSTLGIMGMGRIGQAIAKRGLAFGMNVIYYNRKPLSKDLEQACQATYVDKETLLKNADHVMLVMPYSADSHHLIGAKELAMMKTTATLVNIARGGIVDDNALVEALQRNQIFGAGLDVYEGEPKLHPGLLDLKNVVLAPHIGSATEKTRYLMMNLAIDNLLAGLAGQRPKTMINPEIWYK
jgi:glyoxylate/hydroxypyruvate/2-ketogluconate reductase